MSRDWWWHGIGGGRSRDEINGVCAVETARKGGDVVRETGTKAHQGRGGGLIVLHVSSSLMTFHHSTFSP